MTLDELINDVQMNLTMSGALPKILPDLEIERLIENDAKMWFRENYRDALMKEYLLVPKESFVVDPHTKYKYTILPCNVQNVIWVYMTNDKRFFDLGVSAPNMSIQTGASFSYMNNSYLSTIGELGVYKVIIDGFADMLNQLSKNTMKYEFNKASKQLNILTSMGHYQGMDYLSSIVLEVYTHISDVDMFDLDHFRRYVRFLSEIQLGKLASRYTMNLPGGATLNGSEILSQGETSMTKLMDEIKSMNGGSSFFFMVKR